MSVRERACTLCEVILSCRHCDYSLPNTSATFLKKKVIFLRVHNHHFLTKKIKNKSFILSIDQSTDKFLQTSPKYPSSCSAFEWASSSFLISPLVFHLLSFLRPGTLSLRLSQGLFDVNRSSCLRDVPHSGCFFFFFLLYFPKNTMEGCSTIMDAKCGSLDVMAASNFSTAPNSLFSLINSEGGHCGALQGICSPNNLLPPGFSIHWWPFSDSAISSEVANGDLSDALFPLSWASWYSHRRRASLIHWESWSLLKGLGQRD